MTHAPGIHFEGAATWDGAPVFSGVSADVAPSEWTCLLGPSGVGKTTILRLIAGLDTGVTFDGAIATSDGAALAGRVSYMGQTDLLFPWLDVTGNVGLGARLRGEPVDRERVRDLIGQVGLAGHAAKRPRALSGGMRQRVALARTLMEDQPVVLLDESFSALDARTRAEMQELAAEVLTGRTVLLVTHDPAEAARLGHSILVMSRHGIRRFDPPPVPPIRAYDAPEVFECQTALMAAIRSAP